MITLTNSSMRFIKIQGVNFFPSSTVLLNKLFLADEGKDAGVIEKMNLGDNIYYDKATKDITSAIASHKDALLKLIPMFKSANTLTSLVSATKHFYSNGTHFVLSGKKLLYGKDITKLTDSYDVSGISDISNIIKIIYSPSYFYIVTPSGLYFYDTNSKSFVSKYSGSTIIDCSFSGTYFFIITTGSGVTYSNVISDYNASISWKTAVYVPPTSSGPEGSSGSSSSGSSAAASSGNDLSLSYTGVMSTDTNLYLCTNISIKTYSIQAFITSPSSIMSTATTLMVVNKCKEMIVGGVKKCFALTLAGAYDPSTAVYLFPGKFVNNIYCDDTNAFAIGTTSNNTIVIDKIAGGFGYEYNNPLGNATDIFVTSVSGVITPFVLNGGTSYLTSYDKTDTPVYEYSINYHHDSDLALKQQKVTRTLVGTFDMFNAVCDTSSTIFQSFLKQDSNDANFVVIMVDMKSNKTWFVCGDDKRAEDGFKSIASMFGIST